MPIPAQKITREDFNAKWLQLFAVVFSGRHILKDPFMDPTWNRVLIPYALNFEDVGYDALSTAARSVGDQNAIITDIEPVPPHQDTFLIAWHRQTLDWVRCSTFIGHLDSALFGQSCRWGAVNMVDDFYCCVGGDHKFMEVFVSTAGGLYAIKDRFLRFLKEESDFDPTFQKTLCASVGWRAGK